MVSENIPLSETESAPSGIGGMLSAVGGMIAGELRLTGDERTVTEPTPKKEDLITVLDDEDIDDEVQDIEHDSPVTDEKTCLDILKSYIDGQKDGLRAFYRDSQLTEKATAAMAMIHQLMKDDCPEEIARNLSILTLYDIVMLIDDSSSMKLSEVENGVPKRVETLQKALEVITSVYDHANPDGMLSVRFMNARQGRKNVRSEKVADLLSAHTYTGITRIGTSLKRKVLDTFVSGPKTTMKKPLLVMVVTDGGVEGEKSSVLYDVIKKCIKEITDDPKRGKHAVAFHFSRVGNDKKAAKLLTTIDNHKEIGDWVDCLPASSRLEELKDKELKWSLLAKLLLGAIMKEWDDDDEAAITDTEEMHSDDGVVYYSDIE